MASTGKLYKFIIQKVDIIFFSSTHHIVGLPMKRDFFDFAERDLENNKNNITMQYE